MTALLDGLEEPSSGDSANEVVVESLRGLSTLLSVQTGRPISPRVVLALKPFVEKENNEMRLAAINALGGIARGWRKSLKEPDSDIIEHLYGCLPCLTIRLEDCEESVVEAVKRTMIDSVQLLECESLKQVVANHLAPGSKLNIEGYLTDLINCLRDDVPERADSLR